jgi:hypothetical protein
MKCPKCQTENPEGSLFCGVYRQSLKTENICPQCGHVNLPGFKFCNKCSQPLNPAGTNESLPLPSPSKSFSPIPTSAPISAFFANGHYLFKKSLGEGGKKKVYLAASRENALIIREEK